MRAGEYPTLTNTQLKQEGSKWTKIKRNFSLTNFFNFKTTFFSQPKRFLINLGVNIKTLVNLKECLLI